METAHKDTIKHLALTFVTVVVAIVFTKVVITPHLPMHAPKKA